MHIYVFLISVLIKLGSNVLLNFHFFERESVLERDKERETEKEKNPK